MTKRGRPSSYTPEIADEICKRLSMGESLRAICRDEGMPNEATVRTWALDDKEGFYTQYARARELQALHWAEEILEIADDGSNDTNINPKTGEPMLDSEWMQRSRLRVDTRKWLLSKVLPKVYGDKIDVTSNGKGVGLAINIDLGDDK